MVGGPHRRARRWATAACLLGLTLVSFLQAPGKVTFDTKLDLSVRPDDYLSRALHMWTSESIFGEIQNQAYGYLFPMGPFFAFFQALDVPVWLAQRLWSSLLLCAAFLGVLLLARALRIGSEPARYLGGLAYALAPRMLTEIGPVSSEMLPAVCLPWVLLPLVCAQRLGPRRAALLSGVGVLFMGGVNAAMVLMALPLPGIWLLTRRWDREHVRLVVWWTVAVVAATLWWVIPLLMLGRYSIPFLDYIESAENTTAPLSLFQALRGTNQWVAYVISGEPWWPAGWALVDSPFLMVATGLIAAIGLAGLARRNLPERQFLVLGMLTGLVLLTLGHVGPLDSPVSQWWQSLLDGPLAPFRNVHKFEPMLRLTLVIGFVHGVGVAWSNAWWRKLEIGLAALLVFAVATPAWLLTLRPGPGWDDIPGYWRDAASWLASQDQRSRTLLLPASGFGEYNWGRTVDEPMQPLADSPWAVRSQVPLGSEGNTRFLDAVENALVSGRGSPGLAPYLARAGVRHLLVRNDLDRTRLGIPSLHLYHSALAASRGIRHVAKFGPPVRLDWYAASSLLDAGSRPALEVYEVAGPTNQVSATAVDDAVTVSGGPESVLPLLEQGLITGDQPVVLAGEPGLDRASGPRVVTDGLRRRERNVGRVHDNLSHTLAETDPVRQKRPALDILPLHGSGRLTTAVYHGVRAVTASTAGGYADAYGSTDASFLPYAAIDGDPATLWRSSSLTGPVGQWWEVELDTPRVPDRIRLTLIDDVRIAWPISRLRITTDAGSSVHRVPPGAGPHELALPEGTTSRIRISVVSMVGDREDGNVGIREVEIPGLETSRSLRVPPPGPGVGPPVLAFTRGADPRPACVPVAPRATGTGGPRLPGSPGGPAYGVPVRCDPVMFRAGEEPLGPDRRFLVDGAPGTRPRYRLTATALPRTGGAPAVPTPGSALAVTATSQLAGDPAVAPFLAMDGDRDTAWVADVTDANPVLRLRWKGVRTINQLRIIPAKAPAAAQPVALVLRTLAGRVDASLEDGVARFPTLTTDHLDIEFPITSKVPLDPTGRRSEHSATLGIAEVRIPALRDLARRMATDQSMVLPCGSGPGIEIDGKRYDTSIVGHFGDLQAYRLVEVRPCDELLDGVVLRPGEHRIRTVPSDRFVIHDLVLLPEGSSAEAAVTRREVTTRNWGATRRTVRVAGGPKAYLFFPENANAGWTATLNGKVLDPVRIDGWQQAWLLPEGPGGEVTLEFIPDQTYRTGLLVGAIAAVLLVLGVLIPARRRPAVPLTAEVDRAVTGFVLLALLGLLGGVLPIAVFLACVMLRRTIRLPDQPWESPGRRQVFRPASSLSVVALGGMSLAVAVAVAGRLAGYGQQWALGAWAQAAALVALAAVAASYVRSPDRDQPGQQLSARPDRPPDDAPDSRSFHRQAEQHQARGTYQRRGGDLYQRAVQPHRGEPDLGDHGDPYRRG
ncbi:MAG TPA: alpha-(1-_3)-arabinofuranosyltransferase [Micromonosporaceae bacterium]